MKNYLPITRSGKEKRAQARVKRAATIAQVFALRKAKKGFICRVFCVSA